MSLMHVFFHFLFGNLRHGSAHVQHHHNIWSQIELYIYGSSRRENVLATIMNGMALTDVLEQNGLEARLMTRLQANAVAEPYIRRRALRHLEKKRIVILAGGTGNPFVTTDTASVLAAAELSCDAVLKATKVDGVYDKDPVTNLDAVKYETLTLQETLENPEIRVMDKSAMAMAMDQDETIIVFDLLQEGNIAKVVQGESIGTTVK